MESVPEINLDAAKKTAQRAASSLKSAGSLVAKNAERTKLATVTLPRAYAELGKAIYKDTSRRTQLGDLFKAVDDLLSQREQLQLEAKARPTASSLADKAKKAASEAAAMARTKAIDLQAYQAFAQLGEAVYREKGSESGPPELVAPIVKAIARRDQLDQEIAKIHADSKGGWITPRRIVWAVGAFIGLALLAALVGDIPIDTTAMRRIAEETLPAVYGECEMEWNEPFLAGKKPDEVGMGGVAKLPDGKHVFVSFFPEGDGFVWLSSPTEVGIFASAYSDTMYWDSKGERIYDEEEFWKRAGYPLADFRERAKAQAKRTRDNEEGRRQRNIDRLNGIYEEERAKSRRPSR